MDGENSKNYKSTDRETVLNFILVLSASVLAIKILQHNFAFQFDFVALLSLLLALFSIGLSALFYFKATDTSNAFYDNTYKYTKDIAELLVKIESGFSEKLKHLDEGYTNIRDLLQQPRGEAKQDIKDTQKELKEEEDYLDKKLKERNALIDELAKKARLQEAEKNQFLDQLNKKDEELVNAKREIMFLRKRIDHPMLESSEALEIPNVLIKSLQEYFLSNYNREFIKTAPSAKINAEFKKTLEERPNRRLKLMFRKYDFLDSDGDLTPVAIKLIRALADI